MSAKKITKHSMAVYVPEDCLENAIQRVSKDCTDTWLSMYQCKLMARALRSLKFIDDEWIECSDLLYHRLRYFFQKSLNHDRSKMIFVTNLLFFGDMVENGEINQYIHDPIVFMTVPIANYFFREYPIHLIVDTDILRSNNTNAVFNDIGSLLIVENDNVCIEDAISKVIITKDKSLNKKVDFEDVCSVLSKSAVSNISRGIFKIDEHETLILPSSKVWDKYRRTTATVSVVEPGQTGTVKVQYDDGYELIIPKEFFDSRFIVVSTK